MVALLRLPRSWYVFTELATCHALSMVWCAGMEEANGHANGAFNFERDIDSYIPVEVTETRLTGESQWLSPTYLQYSPAVICTL